MDGSQSDLPRLDGRSLVVIGGGIVGLTAARAAARAGARVAVLEAGRIGAGATDAASGLVTLNPPGRSALQRLRREGYSATTRLLRALGDRLPEGAALHAGALTLYDEAPRDPGKILARWREAGHEASWLSPEDAARRTPGLDHATFHGALSHDREWAIDPVRLVAALRADLEAAGGTVVEGTGPITLVPEGADAVAARDGDGLPVGDDADLVLLAAGWECVRALAPLPPGPLALGPVGGIGLDLAHESPESTVHFGPDHALHWVPRAAGRVYLGSTVRADGATDRHSPDEIEELLARARGHFPGVDPAMVLGVRDGFRPRARTRGGPYVGPWPGRSRLWLATGHYRIGLATAAATAEMLVAAWAGTTPIEPAFSPERGLGTPTTDDGGTRPC